MNETESAVLGAIYARRSIRSYQDREIEPEKLVTLLKAGMAAPSACNLQPWEFIVVSGKQRMDLLREATTEGKYNAPAAVVICANTENIPWGGDGWMIDCSAAVENMMIAAAAMGLGSVWIGSHDEDAVRRLLHIPEKIRVMNLAYFGYPAEEKRPGTRYDPQAVYWQEYDPSRRRQMRTIDMKYDLTVSEP